VVFSPDGKRLASSGVDLRDRLEVVKMWDAQTGQELLTLQGAAGGAGVGFSRDGKRLASGSHDIMDVWDAQTGQKLISLKGHTDSVTNVWVQKVALSPDGKRLGSIDNGGTVKVWDAQTGQQLRSGP
jgi:WD40 repeat protein